MEENLVKIDRQQLLETRTLGDWQRQTNIFAEENVYSDIHSQGWSLDKLALDCSVERTTWLYIILAIVSNELQSCSIESLLGELDSFAHFLVANGYFKKAFVMGLWPRPNFGFCNEAWRFHKRGMTRHWHQDVMFWKWSKKLCFCFEAQAHLKKQCYVRALMYVISLVIFLQKIV